MSETEKFNDSSNASSASQKYPAKEQIIARLVQIREYTKKAEGTLNNMPPNSQNDPKFYQLQEMIAEMRETEEKLVDILRSCDSESPNGSRPAVDNPQGVSHFVSGYSDEAEDGFSVLGAHAMTAVNPELLAEREKLRKRCLDSQSRIEALEKQRKYLLEVCGRAGDPDKMSSSFSAASALNHIREFDMDKRVVLDADSLICARGNKPVQELISIEGMGDSELACQNLSELADKRLEIHNIISEIALLRRAKDESARKIQLLQQALKTSDLNESGLNFEMPHDNDRESTKSNGGTEALPTEKCSNGESSNGISGGKWMSDSFSQTITQKLVEIQTMREKLEALQNLAHDIPSPSNYQTENEIRLITPGVSKEPSGNGDAGEGGKGVDIFGVDDRNSQFSKQLKRDYSARDNFTSSDLDLRKYGSHNSVKSRSRNAETREDYNGASQKSFPGSSSHRLDSPGRSFSVYNGRNREVKPVPVRPQPSAFSDTMIFSASHRSDMHPDDGFLSRNISNNGRLSDSFHDQRNGDILSVNDRIVGHPMLDAGRHWIAAAADLTNSSTYSPSGGDATLPSNPNVYSSIAFDKFVTESHSMLKHVVNSIGALSTGLANQQKQLDNIKDNFGRLAERFEVWLGAMGGPRMPPSVDSGDVRRNNILPGLFTVDNMSGADMATNTSHDMGSRGDIPGEGSSFYQSSRSHPNMFQEINCGYPGGRDVKGGNPNRKMWIGSAPVSNSASTVNGPTEHLNLSGFHNQVPLNSAFYNPNPSGSATVQRPWVSHTTSIEPNRLMLNNQVPPGNRTNNYWDNFRSQSRQNVLSSVAQNNAGGISNSTNNFNRHEKNPGARPVKSVIMTHFVENIGSKKRNQEQQRQTLPQRSVSVGSMPHSSENYNQAIAGPSRVNIRNGTNDANAAASAIFGMNKRYPNRLVERSGNKLTPKEANVLRQAQLGQDWFKEMYAKVSQLKNEQIRSTTIDALRTFVAQSILQDEMESQLESTSSDRNLAPNGNMDLQGRDEAQVSGPAQLSTSSSRSGGFSELMWLDSDPFLSNSSRLLSYHGAVGDAVTDSEVGATRRRVDISGDMYNDSQVYLSGESRLPPRSSGSNEPVSSTALSTSRQGDGALRELWAAAMDMSFLSSEPRVPSNVHADRKKSSLLSSASECREAGLNAETGETFLLNTSRGPPYLIMDRSSDPPNIVARFHEAQKSISEAETSPIVPENIQTPHSVETSANNLSSSSKQVSASGTCSSEAPDTDNIRSPTDVRSYHQGLGDAIPLLRDSSTVEADLDAILLSVSESTNSTDPVSPEMLDLFGNSGFSINVTYKGRSMNSTNNPWIEGPNAEDNALQPQVSQLNKEEASVNEEVAEHTEEQQPRQESPLDKNDRGN